jgi:hypothetical protein
MVEFDSSLLFRFGAFLRNKANFGFTLFVSELCQLRTRKWVGVDAVSACAPDLILGGATGGVLSSGL